MKISAEQHREFEARCGLRRVVGFALTLHFQAVFIGRREPGRVVQERQRRERKIPEPQPVAMRLAAQMPRVAQLHHVVAIGGDDVREARVGPGAG